MQKSKRSPYILSICYLFFALAVQSCLVIEQPYTQVAPGQWRGVLDLRDPATLPPLPEHTDAHTEFDLALTPEGTLPFNFEIEYLREDSMRITLINGADRIPIKKYSFTSKISGDKDGITLYFPVYDTKIVAQVQAGVMAGEWHVDYKNNYKIPFKAHLGEPFRFTNSPKSPEENISGRWEAVFSPDSEEEQPAVGQFTQEGNRLTGTFATTTGDYRFLEGTVTGDDILLSSFDGSQAYLFEGKIISRDSITGAFFSGTHFRTTWEARRNEAFILRDAFDITEFDSDSKFPLRAPAITGETVDLESPEMRGKIKLIEVMGSWCPNCHDETHFLQEWKAENPDFPAEIISVAFERYDDEEKSLEILQSYITEKEIDWPVIYGGTVRNTQDSPLLAPLDRIHAYPTLIIADGENRIRYVHTGFYGPATTEYQSFKEKFNSVVGDLRDSDR